MSKVYYRVHKSQALDVFLGGSIHFELSHPNITKSILL